MRKICLAVAVAMLIGSASAQAGVRFKLGGGVDVATARLSLLGITLASVTKTYPYGGAGLAFSFAPKWGMEIDGKYVIVSGGTVIPIGVWFQFLAAPWFHLDLGGTATIISSMGISSTTIGFGAGLGFDIPFGQSVGLFLDVRYSRGIESVTVDQLFAGVGFRFGSYGK